MKHIFLVGTISALIGQANATVETIEVRGQYTSHVIEQTLSVDATTAPDMREQLAQLPGMNVNSNGQISGIMQYRGMLGERVRVNINGAEVIGAGPNGMDPPISHIMGVPYQQVTLYRGIAPVSVGAEVIGGAVSIDDFAIDFASTAQWDMQGGLTLNVANFGVQSIGGLFHGSNESAYIGISADRQTGDNMVAGDGRTVPSTFYERQAWQMRAGLNLGAHRFDALVSHRDTNAAGTPALNMDILFIDATWFRLSHELNADDDWQWQTRVFGNQNTHDMDNFSLRLAPPPVRQRLNQTGSKALGLESKVRINTLDGHATLGINMSQRSHDSFISNPNNPLFYINNFDSVQRTRASMFVEHQQAFGEGELQFGLRATNVSLDAESIGSNMAMMNTHVASLQDAFNQSDRNRDFALVDITSHWQVPITEEWSLLFAAGLKQRAPTYSELYTWFPLGISGGLADGNNYIGNLGLAHETAKKIDMGIEYQHSNSAFSFHLFYDRIRDYITGQPSEITAANNIALMNNVALPLQWQNTQAVLKGIELDGRYQLSKHWQLTGVAEYVRGIQLDSSDKDLYRIAPFNLRVNLEYQSELWQWRFTTQYVAAQDQVASLHNETESNSYVLADTTITYYVSPQLKVDIAMQNLFDTDYADHLASVNRVNGAEIETGEKIPGAGRTFGLTATYQF